MKTLIIIVVILLTAGIAWSFTWEGELDPNEFDEWKVVSVSPSSQGFLWMFVKNPDQSSAIEIVALAVDLNSTVLGYRYFKSGTLYSYIFDSNDDKYVQQHFTDEQKESCMKCHSDKLVPQASI
jgi:hypothetical protein